MFTILGSHYEFTLHGLACIIRMISNINLPVAMLDASVASFDAGKR